jgi:hypothetical protein
MVGGPVGRGKGYVPEVGRRGGEVEADFTFAFAFVVDEGDAAGLLFARFGITEDEGLSNLHFHDEMNEATVSVDDGGEGLFGERLLFWTDGDDHDGHAQQNTLAATTIVHGGEIGGERGHRNRVEISYGSRERMSQLAGGTRVSKRNGPGGGSRTHTPAKGGRF